MFLGKLNYKFTMGKVYMDTRIQHHNNPLYDETKIRKIPLELEETVNVFRPRNPRSKFNKFNMIYDRIIRHVILSILQCTSFI